MDPLNVTLFMLQVWDEPESHSGQDGGDDKNDCGHIKMAPYTTRRERAHVQAHRAE